MIRGKDSYIRIYDKINSHVDEAYRVLRSNIRFLGLKKPVKTISVVSTKEGEGKTTIAINLAVTMSKAGNKVLLVDADLRKPLSAKRLGNEAETGISDYISGGVDYESIVLSTNIKNLNFIPCGFKPHNPSELIDSFEFRAFIKKVSEQYDVVIFDTPCIGSVIDSAIIASQTDATLLVIESCSVEIEKEKRAIKQLEEANACIIGAVLNKADSSEYSRYYNFYEDVWNGKIGGKSAAKA